MAVAPHVQVELRCRSAGGRDGQPDRLHEPPRREVTQAGEAALQVVDLFLGRAEGPKEGVEGAVLRDDLVHGGGGVDRLADFAAVAMMRGFCAAWSMSRSVIAAIRTGSKP